MGMKQITLILAALTTTTSVFAQTTNLGAVPTKDIFSKMTTTRAAELALLGQVGTCRATPLGTSGANYLYTLKYHDGTKWKTERFGYKSVIQSAPLSQVMNLQNAQSSIEKSAIQKFMTELSNSIFIPSAQALNQTIILPQYTMPLYTINDRLSAKQYLGSRVKTLVMNNRCGTVNFESFNQSVATMKGKVKFYLVDNVIKCTAGDFQKRLRNNATCEDQIVQSPLPQKACTYLYQIESTRSGRNAETQTSSIGPAVLPMISPMTAQIAEDFAVDAVLSANPELSLVASSAEVIAAEHALPSSLVSLIEDKTISSATFDALTSAEKAELVNLVATHDLVQASTAHVKFSPQISSIVSTIKTKANAYALAQNLSAQVYAVPKTLEVADHLNAQLAPITAITKKAYSFNLGCLTQMIAIAPAAIAQMK